MLISGGDGSLRDCEDCSKIERAIDQFISSE